MGARNWTLEQRQRQAEAIRRWKPWKQSTGAKTAEGKQKIGRNAIKHGGFTKQNIELLQELRHVIRASRRTREYFTNGQESTHDCSEA